MDLRNLLGKLDQLSEGTMSSAKKNPTGPKFVGKMKGTDPASAAKDKYVGGMEESIFKELEETLQKQPARDLKREFALFKETKVSRYKDLGATNATTHFIKNVTTGEIVSPHRSKQDAEDALVAHHRGPRDGNEYKIVRARKEGVAEDTGDNKFDAMMSKVTSKKSLHAREALGLMDELIYQGGATYKEALQQASTSFEIDPAKLDQLYKQQASNVAEGIQSELEQLTGNYRALMLSDMLDAEGKRKVTMVYNLLRDPIMQGDKEEYEKMHGYVGGKYPDIFDMLVGADDYVKGIDEDAGSDLAKHLETAQTVLASANQFGKESKYTFNDINSSLYRLQESVSAAGLGDFATDIVYAIQEAQEKLSETLSAIYGISEQAKSAIQDIQWRIDDAEANGINENQRQFSDVELAVMEGGHELISENPVPPAPGQQPQQQSAQPGKPTLGADIGKPQAQQQQQQQTADQVKQQQDAAKKEIQQQQNIQKGVNNLKQAGAAVSNPSQTVAAFDKVADNTALTPNDKNNIASAGTVLGPIMGNQQLAGKFKDLVSQAGAAQQKQAQQQQKQAQQTQQPQMPGATS
jgi:hypothetical protein